MVLVITFFCLLICTVICRSLDGLKDLAASQAPKLKKNETETDFVKLKCKEYEKTNRELEVKELKIVIIIVTIIFFFLHNRELLTLHCYVLKTIIIYLLLLFQIYQGKLQLDSSIFHDTLVKKSQVSSSCLSCILLKRGTT